MAFLFGCTSMVFLLGVAVGDIMSPVIQESWAWYGQPMKLYSCRPGYHPSGTGFAATCRDMPCKSWTGQPLRCAVSDFTPEEPNCLAHYEAGHTTDGVYGIMVEGRARLVYCDMSAGGWTVFQRRIDDYTSFYRKWEDYKRGFGEAEGNLWLGLDVLHSLTQTRTELHVYMESHSSQSTFARYDLFRVGDPESNYRLTIDGFNGTAWDSLSSNNGQAFSTYDADHDSYSDRNCASSRKGGWWYSNCGETNLNGLYLNTNTSDLRGTYWRDNSVILISRPKKNIIMKLRRKSERVDAE